MFKYVFDEDTRGILLKPIEKQDASWKIIPRELRPVYAQELDFYGLSKWMEYDHDCTEPLLWGDMNRLIYNGDVVAKVHCAQTCGGVQTEILRHNLKIEPIDVERMLTKNRAMLDELYDRTTQRLYKNICEVQKHVKDFFLSFSGGKDSCALFYAVERFINSYPELIKQENFAIGFSDTDMENPDVYKTIEVFQPLFEERGYTFIRAKADKSAAENWMHFGPPSRLKRWCCTVHKTTPLVIAYRELQRIRGTSDKASCHLVGVRAAESARRSEYKDVMASTKSEGDVTIYPILDWSSTEVWLSLYDNRSYINKAYMRGAKRVGCLLCPLSDDASTVRGRMLYPSYFQSYDNALNQWYRKQESAKAGWKVRRNALYNLDIESECVVDVDKDYCTLTLGDFRQDYRELLKAIDAKEISAGVFHVEALGQRINFTVEGNRVRILRNHTRNGNRVVSWVKKIFIRSIYCVACRACETFCPKKAIVFNGGNVQILSSCVQCGKCYEKKDVCISYECRQVPRNREKLLERAAERAASVRDAQKEQERNKLPLLRLLEGSNEG